MWARVGEAADPFSQKHSSLDFLVLGSPPPGTADAAAAALSAVVCVMKGKPSSSRKLRRGTKILPVAIFQNILYMSLRSLWGSTDLSIQFVFLEARVS